MKSLFFAAFLLISSQGQASESWVCMCYSDAQATDNVGGVSLDPNLTLAQAMAEALQICNTAEPTTVAVTCEKFNDGQD